MNPLQIITLTFLFSFGQQPIEKLSLSNPQALSVDPKGNIYLADTGNNRIIKFDKQGQFLKSVGGFGWGKEQFDSPLDICAASALDIFIADFNNQRIERYDKDLNYISSYYTDESQPAALQFGYPKGVSISIHGELVLIDSDNSRLLKVDSFGEPEQSFGDFAEGNGKLDNPIQIEISPDDKIYVSDKAAHRIVVFDYFGNYLTDIGRGLLQEPGGIFYDYQDRLWIIDNGKKAVLLFSPSGEVLLIKEAITPQGNKFKNPVDVVCFENRVYVLDGQIIHVFEIISPMLK